MSSSPDSASTILTGWQLKGTRIDVLLRSGSVSIDAAGTVSNVDLRGVPDPVLSLSLVGSGKVKLWLSKFSLETLSPSEKPPADCCDESDFVAGVVMRGDDNFVCCLLEPSQLS